MESSNGVSTTMNNPQITPFKFPKELETLYKNFFLSHVAEHKRQAISKVRSYLTKSPIPHSIEITALLTEAILEDETKTGVAVFNYEQDFPKSGTPPSTNTSDLGIRMQYSMCIIKFVNGLLDPFQQSLYNISLHKLASELNLPNYFVEARHISTHERLPSLQMMRLIAQRSLNWLRTEYWENALNQYKDLNLLSISENDWVEQMKISRKKQQAREKREKESENEGAVTKSELKLLEELLKSLKKIRKQEIQERRQMREFAEKMNQLKAFIGNKDSKSIIQLLIFKNYLILHGDKNENMSEKQIAGIQKMWSNIMVKLPKDFIYEAWKVLFKLSSKHTLVDYDFNYVDQHILNQTSIEYLQNEGEILQAKEWVCWLLENVEFVGHSNIADILKLLMTDSDVSKKCLPILKEKYGQLLMDRELDKRVEKMESIMERFWVSEHKLNKRKLEDIEPEAMSGDCYIQKKQKTSAIELFEMYPSWRPVPFGCPP